MPAPAKMVQEHQAAAVEKQNVQEAVVERSPEQTPLRLTTRAFIQADVGSGPPHSNLRHLPALQRPNLALKVGQVHANGLLQRLLRRQAGTGDIVIRRVPVTRGGYTTNTGGEAAPLISAAVALIQPEMLEVPKSDPAYTAAALAVKEGEIYVTNLSGQADQEIDTAMAGQLGGWYADYSSALTALDTYKKNEASKRITAAMANATSLQGQTEAALSQFELPLQQAFAQNDTERLTKLNKGINALQTAQSRVAELKQGLLDAFSLVLSPGIEAASLAPQLTPVYDKIGLVGAAFSTASGVISLIGGGEGTTQSEKDISKVATVIDATSGVATLLGVAGGYMVAIGPILPIAAELFKTVSAFQRADARQWNQVHMGNMDLDSVQWEYVPGGAPVLSLR